MYIIECKHQSLKESKYLLNADTLLKLLNQNIGIIEWCTYLTKQASRMKNINVYMSEP